MNQSCFVERCDELLRRSHAGFGCVFRVTVFTTAILQQQLLIIKTHVVVVVIRSAHFPAVATYYDGARHN